MITVAGLVLDIVLLAWLGWCCTRKLAPGERRSLGLLDLKDAVPSTPSKRERQVA